MNHWTEAEARTLWQQIDVFLRMTRVLSYGSCSICGRRELHLHKITEA